MKSADQTAISVTAMTATDLDDALALQSRSYPAFLVEDASAFASRMGLAASFCLAARREGELLGYLLAHGWPRCSPPAVGTVLTDCGPGDVLFIHDLAVASAGRGSGVGRMLIARAFDLAARAGLRRAELIAVEGAADYWRRLGFVAVPVSGTLAAKVATYGPQACWMEREILQDR